MLSSCRLSSEAQNLFFQDTIFCGGLVTLPLERECEKANPTVECSIAQHCLAITKRSTSVGSRVWMLKADSLVLLG